MSQLSIDDRDPAETDRMLEQCGIAFQSRAKVHEHIVLAQREGRLGDRRHEPIHCPRDVTSPVGDLSA